MHFYKFWGGVFVLAGCSTMSVEECKTADWAKIGEKDG